MCSDVRLPCYFIKHKETVPPTLKTVSQTRLRSPFPHHAVGDKVPSFRDSEAAAVENAARNRATWPLFANRDPGRNERFLDAVTIWILEHLVGWHCLAIARDEYNAARGRKEKRTFQHTPDIHDGSADDKAFSRPKRNTKDSPDSRDYPGFAPEEGQKKTRCSPEDLVFQRRSS